MENQPVMSVNVTSPVAGTTTHPASVPVEDVSARRAAPPSRWWQLVLGVLAMVMIASSAWTSGRSIPAR